MLSFTYVLARPLASSILYYINFVAWTMHGDAGNIGICKLTVRQICLFFFCVNSFQNN